MRRPLELQQREFASALVDAEAAPPIVAHLFAPDARALSRLGLYRANVDAAAARALANAYPVVRCLIGDECFRALAGAYAQAHPSASGDLGRFGAELAAFARGWKNVAALPYLADVAALEWLVHRAYFAADGRVAARHRIAALAATDLLAARFSLHPACAWIESSFAIATIWRAHQPGSGVALPSDAGSAETALVVRPQWNGDVLASDGGEIAALRSLRAGNDMEAAIAAGLGADPRFDFPRALVRWLDNAVLVEVDDAQ